MNKREPRLQSPALQAALNELDDLCGQALADAAFQRKLAAMKRRAQREILASFGKAMDAFSVQWKILDTRQQLERERFVRREGHMAGRVLNAARSMPLASFEAAFTHMKAGLVSAHARERALAGAQQSERNDLALKQRRFRLTLSRPHQDVLDMITVKSAEPAPQQAPTAAPDALEQLRLKGARKRIAEQIVRSMEGKSGKAAPRDRIRISRKAPEHQME